MIVAFGGNEGRAHRRAIKVYERAGFRVVREFGEGATGWMPMVRPVRGD